MIRILGRRISGCFKPNTMPTNTNAVAGAAAALAFVGETARRRHDRVSRQSSFSVEPDPA